MVDYVPLLTEELEKHYCDPDLLATEETNTENSELNSEITTNDMSTSDTNTKEDKHTDQSEGKQWQAYFTLKTSEENQWNLQKVGINIDNKSTSNIETTTDNKSSPKEGKY